MYVHVTGRREGMLTLGRVERVRTYVHVECGMEWHIYFYTDICM